MGGWIGFQLAIVINGKCQIFWRWLLKFNKFTNDKWFYIFFKKNIIFMVYENKIGYS